MWIDDAGLRRISGGSSDDAALYINKSATNGNSLYVGGKSTITETGGVGLEIKGSNPFDSNTAPAGDYSRLWIHGGHNQETESGMTISSTTSGRIYFMDETDDDPGVVAYSHGYYMWFKVETDECVRFYGSSTESIKTDDNIDTASDFFTNGHQ